MMGQSKWLIATEMNKNKIGTWEAPHLTNKN
jgi:hypothetical protein